MMPRRIRLFWTVGAVLAVLMVAGVAAAVLVPRLLPLGDEGSLYRRYRNMPGIEATYLKDFPVDDTLTVDVTTLTATDDEGWDTLCSDFNVPELPDFIQEKINNGNDMVIIRHVTKGNPSLQLKESESVINDVASISILNRTVSIFHTETEAEQLAVNSHQFGLGFED